MSPRYTLCIPNHYIKTYRPQTDFCDTIKMMFFSTDNNKYNVRGVKMLTFTEGDTETVKKGNCSPRCNSILKSFYLFEASSGCQWQAFFHLHFKIVVKPAGCVQDLAVARHNGILNILWVKLFELFMTFYFSLRSQSTVSSMSDWTKWPRSLTALAMICQTSTSFETSLWKE